MTWLDLVTETRWLDWCAGALFGFVIGPLIWSLFAKKDPK